MKPTIRPELAGGKHSLMNHFCPLYVKKEALKLDDRLQSDISEVIK